ncbi:MAG: COG1361 family protein, partial [Planctomycetota bacterium]
DQASTLAVVQQPQLALSATGLTFTVQEGDPAPAPQTVGVSNAGGGTLATVSASPTYDSTGSGWLTVGVSGSGDTQTLTNTVDPSGLSPNTYSATVAVSAAGASNSPQSYTVSFTVTAIPSTTQPTMVLDPTSLQLSAEEDGAPTAAETVAVTNSGADTLSAISATVSYVSGSDWLEVTAAGTGNSQSVENVANPAGLAPDTYTATVQVDSSGASNTPQNYTVSFTVTPKPTGSPDAGVPDLGAMGDSGVISGDSSGSNLGLTGGCSLGHSPGGEGSAALVLVGFLLLGLLRRRL